MNQELDRVLRAVIEAAVKETLSQETSGAKSGGKQQPEPRRSPLPENEPKHLQQRRFSPAPSRFSPAHLEGKVQNTKSDQTATSPYQMQVFDGNRLAQPGVENPRNKPLFDRLLKTTPTRIGTGRAGTRYRTETYLELRADHAIAKDAVYAELPPDLAAKLGCIEVKSRCNNREHYLLYPNDGRRLDDSSRALLAQQGTRSADVQIIVADGLAAPALMLNGPKLLPAFITALQQRGLTVAKPILAHMARVGLQDDIGVLLQSRATAICLGERPGLGTGDSLSIYIAVAPGLDQDNALKNCLSNIRPQGLAPAHAAEMAAELLKRGLILGKSGLVLAQSL
ncbi:MAG: ethanolamine ammonia-lyase subunit EutC [Myxococcales bacterium]|nr:ethanolamine ammonia-lyase subunit EutC [Myxococcales bacterium]